MTDFVSYYTSYFFVGYKSDSFIYRQFLEANVANYSPVCRGSKHNFVSEDIFWGSGSSLIPQDTVRSHRVTLYNSSLFLRNFSINLLLTIANFHLHQVDSFNFSRVKRDIRRQVRVASGCQLSALCIDQ